MLTAAAGVAVNVLAALPEDIQVHAAITFAEEARKYGNVHPRAGKALREHLQPVPLPPTTLTATATSSSEEAP